MILKSYPSGGRMLRVYSAGRDTQFWAGFYGTKIAGSQLIISMENSPPSDGSSTVADASRFQSME